MTPDAYAECHNWGDNAECRYAECRFAECRGEEEKHFFYNSNIRG
jgi:hypothetical protein